MWATIYCYNFSYCMPREFTSKKTLHLVNFFSAKYIGLRLLDYSGSHIFIANANCYRNFSNSQTAVCSHGFTHFVPYTSHKTIHRIVLFGRVENPLLLTSFTSFTSDVFAFVFNTFTFINFRSTFASNQCCNITNQLFIST